MEKPMCKVCGERHWAREGHPPFGGEVRGVVVVVAEKPPSRRVGFDRVRYMRDYMRRRRLAAKLSRGATK